MLFRSYTNRGCISLFPVTVRGETRNDKQKYRVPFIVGGWFICQQKGNFSLLIDSVALSSIGDGLSRKKLWIDDGWA